MTSKKERRKLRRRAEKNMEEAWEALASGNPVLAEKLSRRALGLGQVNPRIWNDHGSILQRCGHLDEAEQAFRTAISLAPSYADAFASLAALQAEKGKLVQAERLQRRVVELQPDSQVAREVLESYRRSLPEHERVAVEEGETVTVAFTERTERYDWSAVESELRARGGALLRGLLSTEECGALIALNDDEERFEHVEYGQEGDSVTCRFFRRPLPELVQELRTEVYARAAGIANRWNELLGREGRFPLRHDAFLELCRQAGQHRAAPSLLVFAEHGSQTPHRDDPGRVVFPLQLLIMLGPGGGEFLLVDQRPGRRQRRLALSMGAGDGVLFCCRERLVEIAGALGLQPVLHGVAEVPAPGRALEIPFHDQG